MARWHAQSGIIGGLHLAAPPQSRRPWENLTLCADDYNLLGIFDRDLSKRNYYTSAGGCRDHAPVPGFWLICRFRQCLRIDTHMSHVAAAYDDWIESLASGRRIADVG